MAVILALDTSTEACSCALFMDGTIHERYAVVPRQHAQLILPMIRDLLAAQSLRISDVDAIAFGQGPGSFTGLRIAAGVTQGIAFAADLPVIPVSTLAAIALDVFLLSGADSILACLDARIEEVYWGQFQIADGLPQAVGSEHLCRPEDMAVQFRMPDVRPTAGGNGLIYLPRFPAAIHLNPDISFPQLLPRAGHIATIAAPLFQQKRHIAAEDVHPVYLRDKVTHQ
jgi:tRNA threonylcarbamoyladenosine biosynthesis protein TsaB